MSSPPASAERADKAGAGPEGRKRTWSVESGATTDTTLVADSEPAKPTELDHAMTSRAPRVSKRAASASDLAAQAAKRGRVTAEAALGVPGPAITSKTKEGSSTAAAPCTDSTITATALAVADTTTHDLPKPQEASKASSKDRTHLAPACTCARDVHAFSRGDEGYADFLAHAVTLTISTTGPVVTPNVPAAPIASAQGALAAIVGGQQSQGVVIDWAAVAADGLVPPPSATALRHFAGALQPLLPMQAAYVQLANAVRLEPPAAGVDPDSAAEQRLRDETEKIRSKVAHLFERAGRPASGTRLKSSRASKAEIAAAVREAELADLESYMFEHERNGQGSNNSDGFN